MATICDLDRNYLIVEEGACSIMDFPYDRGKYFFVKMMHNRRPRYFDRLYAIRDDKPDAVVYSRGMLTSKNVDDMIEVNVVSHIEAMRHWTREGVKNHIILGSICGMPDGSYPTKEAYACTKKLLRIAVEEMQKEFPENNYIYMPLPGIKTKMTENSSGYKDYISAEEAHKMVMKQVNDLISWRKLK